MPPCQDGLNSGLVNNRLSGCNEPGCAFAVFNFHDPDVRIIAPLAVKHGVDIGHRRGRRKLQRPAAFAFVIVRGPRSRPEEVARTIKVIDNHVNGAGLFRAFAQYRATPGWAQLMRVGMGEQLSWEGPARQYMALYEQATGARREVRQRDID